jgi:hypothetical protein
MHGEGVTFTHALLLLLAPAALWFLIWVYCHLRRETELSRERKAKHSSVWRVFFRGSQSRLKLLVILAAAFILTTVASGQQADSNGLVTDSQTGALERKVDELEKQLVEIRTQLQANRLQQAVSSPNNVTAPAPPIGPAMPAQEVTSAAPNGKAVSLLPASATLSVLLDGYYGYNLNHPPGRVNSLRAYDVLSDAFSLNQAAIVFELPTDVENGRRYGARVDLQFGQATATLQGNPANELRPDIYRNIFQAYGRYVVPVPRGLTLDFGKWASSLGYEANYTKDQLNYSRSFFFYYLPFYHMGIRASYPLNDKLAFNYWLTNGTQQTEPFNSFKDEMFGLNLTPARSVNWTVNYYLGQEHPDVTASSNCGTAPLQPGLCFTPIMNPPNGKTHIFDSYATWQVTPKFLVGGEGDYVIQRQWANAAPGESSAPSRVSGGAAYASYGFIKQLSLSARTEYMSDRDGLFSGTSQALKEATGTLTYHLGDGFQTMIEYRRDWSNQNFFPRGVSGVLVDHQDTATMGLVWWYGNKEGTW